MKIVPFDTSSRALRTGVRKMLMPAAAATAVATILATLSSPGTTYAVTTPTATATATSTPGMTITVNSGARQTLKMVGSSGMGDVTGDDSNHTMRDAMLKLTFGDAVLNMKVARLWVDAGRHLDNSTSPNLQDIPTAQKMADQVYSRYGGPTGFVESTKSTGFKLLLGPVFQLPNKIGPTPTPTPTGTRPPAPTATPTGSPTPTPTPVATLGPVEASLNDYQVKDSSGNDVTMPGYITRLVECIRILRDPAKPYHIHIDVTGLANEPTSLGHNKASAWGAVDWKPYDMALGVQLLSKKLNDPDPQKNNPYPIPTRNVDVRDVAIIAPETSTGAGAKDMVAAIKNGIGLPSVAPVRTVPPGWNSITGIASHSYGMAATDSVGSYVGVDTGASTKDWWITEAGKVNRYGDDDVNAYEAPTTTSPYPLPTKTAKPEDASALDGASLLSARFLNDMNHGVTHWIWFQPYGQKPGSDQCLVNPIWDSSGKIQGKVIRSKYWYFKQLREAFPDGTVFRRSNSNVDGDMSYGYNDRAHVSVAAGKAPDGTWRVSVLNLTPVETDPANDGTQKSYASQSYPVTVDITELHSTPMMQFVVTHSNPEGIATGSEIVMAINGLIKIPVVNTQELITLATANAETISYYTRTGYANRMVGGVFEGSNVDKVSGPWSTLATITSTPTDNQWNVITTLSNPGTYHYLRYRSPDHSYGNVGEVKFYSHGVLLTGYPYGTPSSVSSPYSSGSNAYKHTFQQVYDVDHTTYFDTGLDTTGGSAPATNPGNPYAGIDTWTTPGDGNGLTGNYYSDPNATTHWSSTSLSFTQTDPMLSFDWGISSPAGFGANKVDNFSVRWTGWVQAVEAGSYTFRIVANDGAYLYLDDDINSVVNGSGTPYHWEAPRTLVAGQFVRLKCDYFENDSNAYARLEWHRPDMATGAYETVPKSQLFVAPPP